MATSQYLNFEFRSENRTVTMTCGKEIMLVLAQIDSGDLVTPGASPDVE